MILEGALIKDDRFTEGSRRVTYFGANCQSTTPPSTSPTLLLSNIPSSHPSIIQIETSVPPSSEPSLDSCTHEAQHEFILLMTTDNKPTKTTLEVFYGRKGVFELDNPRISNTYTSVVTNDKTARCLVKRLCFMLVIDDVGGDGAGSYQAYWNGEKHCMRR